MRQEKISAMRREIADLESALSIRTSEIPRGLQVASGVANVLDRVQQILAVPSEQEQAERLKLLQAELEAQRFKLAELEAEQQAAEGNFHQAIALLRSKTEQFNQLILDVLQLLNEMRSLGAEANAAARGAEIRGNSWTTSDPRYDLPFASVNGDSVRLSIQGEHQLQPLLRDRESSFNQVVEK